MERYTFGSYPHNGGRENITWLVLKRKGNEVKLISEYILDVNSFSSTGGNVWEDSSLREWLQDDFLNNAFTEEQQEALVEEMCECEQWEDREVIDTDFSFDTVTLLSLDEVREYFPTNDARIAKATQYAQDEGAEIEYAADCCGWWLRSPGIKTMGISSWNSCVMADGTVKPWGVFTRSIGVRPVITVDLDLAASCQYDMVEDDEEDLDPIAALERMQELLDRLKALQGAEDDDDDDNDLDLYDDDDDDLNLHGNYSVESGDQADDSNKPVVLRTITDVYRVNEAVSIQIPSGFVCEETLGKDGESVFNIKAGSYSSENGDTYWHFNAGVVDCEMSPDEDGKLYSGMKLIERAIDNLEASAYIKLPGMAPSAFIVKKTPIRFGENMIKIYAISMVIPWAEGKEVLLTQMYNITGGTEHLKESYAYYLAVAKSIRVYGKPLDLNALTVDDMLCKLVPSFDDKEEGVVKLRVGVDINGQDAGTIIVNQNGSVTHDGLGEIPQADPPGYLWSHYRQVQPRNLGMPNVRIIVNANGTEFDPISMETVLENHGDGMEDMLEIVREYKRTDSWQLPQQAKELAEVFRVDVSAFSPQHDRLGDIYAGNLQKCYTLSALRSFAWTLCEIDDIESFELDELLQVIDFIAERNWLNYKPNGAFEGLYDQPDLHVMYMPDELCTEENSRRLRESIAQMPVASLDNLRGSLEILYPAMKKLADMLGKDRNRMEQLAGNAADVLYAWCALCVAAEEPFYSEDGPMMCCWDYPGDALAYGMYRSSSWVRQREEQKKAHWLETYGEYVSEHGDIHIAGKKFVFTGLGVLKGEQKDHPVVQKVLNQGGLYRSSISGVTDYLVVGEDNPGETKIKAAIEQKMDGKQIQIVSLKALEERLNGETSALTENRLAAPIKPVGPTETAVPVIPEAEIRSFGESPECKKEMSSDFCTDELEKPRRRRARTQQVTGETLTECQTERAEVCISTPVQNVDTHVPTVRRRRNVVVEEQKQEQEQEEKGGVIERLRSIFAKRRR